MREDSSESNARDARSDTRAETGPDPLELIDAVQRYAEQLCGAVAVLVADGWTDEQARLLVLKAVLRADQP